MQFDNMKKIKNLSTAGTVICIITLVLYIILALVFLFGTDFLMGFANDNMNKMTDVDSNSPSAGFEVIAYLAGGGLGFIGGLFTFILAFFMGGLSIYQLPAIIAGLVANNKYKKADDKTGCLNVYRTDGFIKAIMNGIVLAGVILLLIGNISEVTIRDFVGMITAVWNYIAVFVLSVLEIKAITEGNV